MYIGHISLGGTKIYDSSRGMGVRVVAGKGSGKSRLIGRTLVFQDFARRIPTIVIDPTQSLLNNVLDKVLRLPIHVQKEAYKRIRYVNLTGQEDTKGVMRVVPFPLLYKARTPFEAAQRFTDVIERADPFLRGAPMLGIEALRNIATDVGSVLYALGWQYSEAEKLIFHARDYQGLIEKAAEQYPDIEPSVDYLLHTFPSFAKQEQLMRTSSFLSRTQRFSRDEISRAIYCAHAPAFSWQEMVDDKLLVLFDVSRVPTSQRKFAMLWIYHSFIDWVRLEGGLARFEPISLVIDELTNMLGNPADTMDPVAEDLRELLDVIARNYRLWVTVLHQEENQVSRQVQQRLDGIGTQIVGVTSDPDSALKLARRYVKYDPYKKKKEEPIYGSESYTEFSDPFLFPYGEHKNRHIVIDHRPVEFTIEEQLELNSRRFLELEQSRFKIGTAYREGSLPTALSDLDTSHIEPGKYPQEYLLSYVRANLIERNGLPVQDVIGEITGRGKARERERHVAEAPLPVSERRVPRKSRS